MILGDSLKHIKSSLSFLYDFLKDFEEGMREESVEYIEFERKELENIFALLLMGSYIGIPSPPSDLSIRLMPYMIREMMVMSRRSEEMDDLFGEMMGTFDID